MPQLTYKQRKNLKARKLAIKRGDKFYFTGNPCPKGHIAERFTSTCNCRICQHEYIVKNFRRYFLQRKYKITLAQYKNMLKKQKYVCAICKKKEKTIDGQTRKIKLMSVDHCHDTNKIRGLLCNNCNQGIGKFKHNSKFLRAAALYCEET